MPRSEGLSSVGWWRRNLHHALRDPRIALREKVDYISIYRREKDRPLMGSQKF